MPAVSPFVGNQLLYFPSLWDKSGPGAMVHQTGAPLLAFVAAVNRHNNVNLVVFDAVGKPHSRTSIPLLVERAPDVPAGTGQAYAVWPSAVLLQAGQPEPEPA